jgi:4-amino-4-deoxy-L-arabinose transferase-like glycosyltransferase
MRRDTASSAPGSAAKPSTQGEVVGERPGPPKSATWIVVLLFASVAAVLAVVVADRVYPYGTINRDDQAYLAQARLLRDGNLTLPRSQATFFRPNMTAIRGNKLVYLYTSAWPAVLAASDTLFGSTRPALAITAALTVVALALLAAELWSDRRVVLAATVIFTFSPLFVSQSGTYLSYGFSLLLYLAFGWLLLRGLRTSHTWTLIAAGAVIGAAFFARPFDSLLVAVPFALYGVFTRRRDPVSLLRPVGWLVLGALPLLVLTAALNQQLMGSPMSFPQNAAGSLNKFGFGQRLGIHDQHTNAAVPVHFTPGKSVTALWTDVQLLPRWMLGSYVALPLAMASVIRRRRDARVWLLVALVVAFPLGYLFWWGNYLATTLFKLVYWLGPYYYYPTVACLALLAGDGVIALVGWLARAGTRSTVAGTSAVTAIAIVVTALGLQDARNYASRLRHEERAALAPLKPMPRNSLLLLEQSQIGNPYPELVNLPDLSNRPLYALSDVDRNMELLERYPRTRAYALRNLRNYGDDIFTRPPRPTLVPLEQRSASIITETLTFENRSAKRYVIAYAQQGDRIETRVIDAASSRARRYTVQWTIAAPDLPVAGPHTLLVRPTAGSSYVLGFATSQQPSLAGADRFELRWSYAARLSGPIRVADPPAPYVDLQFPSGASVWVEEHLEPVVIRNS